MGDGCTLNNYNRSILYGVNSTRIASKRTVNHTQLQMEDQGSAFGYGVNIICI